MVKADELFDEETRREIDEEVRILQHPLLKEVMTFDSLRPEISPRDVADHTLSLFLIAARKKIDRWLRDNWNRKVNSPRRKRGRSRGGSPRAGRAARRP
jgi:hypothetical protein